jgi:hypothetical protein
LGWGYSLNGNGMDVEKFLETIGGLRPGARKLKINLSMVYGWQKMGNIPYPRRIDLYDQLHEEYPQIYEQLFPELASRGIAPKRAKSAPSRRA